MELEESERWVRVSIKSRKKKWNQLLPSRPCMPPQALRILSSVLVFIAFLNTRNKNKKGGCVVLEIWFILCTVQPFKMSNSVDVNILTECSHHHSQFRTFTSPWKETFSYHLYPPYSLSDLSNRPSNIRIFFLVWDGGGAAPRSLWDHKPMPSTMEVWSLNHWTAREFVNIRIFNGTAEGVEREAMLGTFLWSMGLQRVGHCWSIHTFTLKQFITIVLWSHSEGWGWRWWKL